MACGCGRSPTGKCIGWHKLTEEEFQKKLERIILKKRIRNYDHQFECI